MNTATATVYQLPVREPLHLVHLETGELLTDGEESLNELADQVSALLDRQVRDAWELGRLVALARLRCEDKDCGIAGRNPNERFGKWVCTNFMQTNRNSILNARRLWEVFGDRQAEVSFLPQSALYQLAEPKCDLVRDDLIAELGASGERVKVRQVTDAIKQVVSATKQAREGIVQVAPADACTTEDLRRLVADGRRYGCIYADPPWQYGNQGTRAATGNHYSGMTIEELMAMPIQDLAADNAHLHLWTTNAFLFESLKIMEAWGFCVGVGTRILTDDLRWVKAESLSVGDGILAFDESRQDETGRRYYKFGKVLSTGIEKLPCYLITLENGTELISSDAHAWLMRTSHTGRESGMRWIRTENMGKHLSHHARRTPLEMPVIAPVVDVDRSYEAGFLSAAFDSEGSIDKNKPRLSFVQKDNALLKTVQGYLKEKGYSIVTRDYDYSSTSHVELNGGTKETLRFMMSCRPPRLLEKFRATNLKHSLYCLENVPVKSVRFIGDYPVVTLMTDTGTYIAEGFGSHNTYKSCFVWVKPQMGLGNYWRVSHEFMLFGLRGKKPFGSRSEMSWGQYQRSIHSRKPDEVRKKIEKVSGGPYLELFGRMPVRGWTVYGNQIARDMLTAVEVDHV